MRFKFVRVKKNGVKFKSLLGVVAVEFGWGAESSSGLELERERERWNRGQKWGEQ